MTVNRVPMRFPGHTAVVEVAEEQVDRYVEQGWTKLRRRAASTDTGSTPTQPPASR